MPMPPSQRNRMKVQMSRGSAGADRGYQEEHRRQQKRLLAPEAVRDRPHNQHPGRATDQHAPRRPALHHHVELEANRQKLNGPGDDARVVAEKQSAERRHEADGDEVGEVRANGRD